MFDIARALWFHSCLCATCPRSKRGQCWHLLFAASVKDPDHPQFPRAIQKSEIGWICTAYEGDVETYAVYRDEKQMSMF